MTPTTLGLDPSFGFGDRIGCATPGHVASMVRDGNGIAPIFPQQSIREMTRTARTPDAVMRDALAGMRDSGWTKPTGADADHLKTPEDVDVTAAAGFTFFTIDPSAFVVDEAATLGADALRSRTAELGDVVDWLDDYRGTTVDLDTGTTIDLDDEACRRAAVKYGRAIRHACEMSDHITQVHTSLGRDFEIELSVDETAKPTTLAEHWIIADRCRRHGMKLVSLAPRFVGDFEKGIDFKGDLAELDRSLHDHAAIARALGPYKLSLHSGSDKLSMYAMLARATKGQWHVKTAGTSYLEAVRVAAKSDEPLFRRIVDFARDRYETDRATYHVSATLASAPPQSDVRDAHELEGHYLEHWSDVPEGKGFTAPGRQILHTTFGSTLTDAELGPALKSCLEQNLGTYTELLDTHFSRHLRALQAGM